MRSASGMPSRSNVCLDLLGDVVPRLLFALGRLAVVDDLVEVDLREVAAPRRHRPLQEVVVGAQAELEHPLRLVLDRADLLDRVARQAALGLRQVDDVVVEGVLVASVLDEVAGGGHGSPRRRGDAAREGSVNSESLYRNSSRTRNDGAGVGPRIARGPPVLRAPLDRSSAGGPDRRGWDDAKRKTGTRRSRVPVVEALLRSGHRPRPRG